MGILKKLKAGSVGAVCLLLAVSAAWADSIVDVTVDGPDAIFLAGRTDLSIPAANLPWNTGTFLIRHGGPTPEEALEQLPPSVTVVGGDIIRVLDPADGGVNFFNGFGPPYFGPGGNGLGGSNLNPLGGISGYIGPQGPLVGVFLDDSIPTSGAPATLDFSPSGLGIDFLTLAPLLGQIFYIGDGVTSGGVFHEFTAPVGATRLFLGIPDGFGFTGNPGAYDDNDGSYRVRLGINQIPSNDIPEPATALTVLGCLALLALGRKRLTR
ncbi:MAG: hypothetical protein U5J83_02700 [Bryobacterales bacterium]|nr:hypothetical protein [Bryobacterales bacterium]